MSIFKDRDVICTLGDSITASGLWMAEAYEHIGKEVAVKFYNCGVSGGTATRAADYLYSMCLSKNPDYVTVMFGVNDIDRWAFSKSYKGNDQKEITTRAVNRYAEKMEYITRCIIDSGAKPILCTPMPYDEREDLEEENYRCDYLLEECAEIVRALAKRYGCLLVDFRARLLPLMNERHPIGIDRVHPTTQGYHMMGQIFLHELREISDVDFDTPYEFALWNKERYDAERKLMKLYFIDYAMLFDSNKARDGGVPEKLAEAKVRYDELECKDTFIGDCYRFYIEEKKHQMQIMNDLVRLTVYPPKD